MSNNFPNIDELRESFNRVYDGADRLQREYDLVREAERLSVPLDTYRRLYELRKEEHIEPYPQPEHWRDTLFDWNKWFRDLPKSKKLALVRKGGFWAVRQSFFLTVVIGLVNYIREAPKRQKLAHYQAWQVINSAVGQTTSGGRIEALQDLNKDRVSLDGLYAKNANLARIQLQKAYLAAANFNNAFLGHTNFSDAFLVGADLSNASLTDANFSNADLIGANLNNAHLDGANLKSVDFDCLDVRVKYGKLVDVCTNLKGTEGITPEQIKQAKNWQKACYDPKFRIKLGLPPENPKCAGEESIK